MRTNCNPGHVGTAALGCPAERSSAALDSGPGLCRRYRGILGFTILELMIVMAIIAILLAIAIPTYSHSLTAAHERALRSDLELLREAIWNYTFDKQKAPQSLDDLRSAGYIEKIPDDPMTKEPNWEVVQEDVLLSVDQQDSGIIDVHSASNAMASDGTAYSTW